MAFSKVALTEIYTVAIPLNEGLANEFKILYSHRSPERIITQL